MSSNNDPAAALAGFVIGLIMLYVAFVAAIFLLAIAAIFVIGWYVTHLLIGLIDAASEGQLRTEHGGLLLLFSGAFWALVGWIFIPFQWIYTLTDIWPNIIAYPSITAFVGGALGLTWAFLSLFTTNATTPADPLDLSGMYSFAESDLAEGEPKAIDLLTDSIILGTEDDI